MKDIIYNIYKTLFKWFIIEKDYNILSKLKNDGVTQLMIIKKSWIFGLLISWVLLVTVTIGIFNIIAIYDLSVFIKTSILLYIIIWIIIYSIVSLILNSVLFLIHFKRTYWNLNATKDIDSVINEVKIGDKLFKKFFSNVTINIFIFIFATIFYVSIIIFLYSYWKIGWVKEIFFVVLNIFLFIIQILLMNHYRRRMINFDMTYDMVIPWEMFFISQKWFISEVKTIEADIIRTIDWKYGDNFLYGFLDLGTIEIITIWWLEQLWTIDMTFINKPEETAINIKDILLSSKKTCSNSYLQKIINKLDIKCSDVDKIEVKEKISKYLHDNESEERKNFELMDSASKKDFEEVFELYYNIKK